MKIYSRQKNMCIMFCHLFLLAFKGARGHDLVDHGNIMFSKQRIV